MPWQMPTEQSLPHVQGVPTVGVSGGSDEHWLNRQLPPGHWESAAQGAGSSCLGSGEHSLKRQLPPGHSASVAQVCGDACDDAVSDGWAGTVTQPASHPRSSRGRVRVM